MKKILSYVVTTILILILFVKIITNIKSINALHIHLNLFNLTALCIVISLIYLVNIYSWHLVTRALSTRLSFKNNFNIWIMSNLSRLIPGGIWQYPSRILLMSKNKVSKSIGISAVTIEALMTLSMGGIVFLFSLSFWKLPIEYKIFQKWIAFTLVSPVLIFFLFNKKTLKFLEKFASRLTKKSSDLKNIPTISPKWLAPLTLAFAMRFIVIGSALFIVINLFMPFDISFLPSIIGIYALSWLVGYVAIFAPGGLGVTEGILSALLSFYFPVGQAIFFAIFFRGVLLIGETIFIFAALTIKTKDNRIKK